MNKGILLSTLLFLLLIGGCAKYYQVPESSPKAYLSLYAPDISSDSVGIFKDEINCQNFELLHLDKSKIQDLTYTPISANNFITLLVTHNVYTGEGEMIITFFPQKNKKYVLAIYNDRTTKTPLRKFLIQILEVRENLEGKKYYFAVKFIKRKYKLSQKLLCVDEKTKFYMRNQKIKANLRGNKKRITNIDDY